MKKTIYTAVLFLIFGMAATSCKKTETVVNNTTEKGNFIAAIDATKFNVTASGSGNYSYGLVFSVSKNGKATELGCTMPVAGTYKVTLWDSTSNRAILAQADVTVSAGGKSYVSITPQTLSTGKIYLLTIQSSGQWYYVAPKAGGSIPYPLVSGSINILGYQWVGSTSSSFPTMKDNTYIAGLVDLTFKAD